MNHPAKAMQRRVVGWACIGTANTLKAMLKANLGIEWDDSQLQHYAGAKEVYHIREARHELKKAEKRLRAVGKKILGGEYGGN